jgi:acyl-CoA thioesterase
MLNRTQHLFDEATRVFAGDSRWRGRTSPDYYAFVGPFGGFTAATILRALIEHPQRTGDPLALTVNYCAPIAEGEFDLDVRLIKANRSSQHWCVELSQGGADVAALATAVFAERRPSWSHQPAQMPDAKPFETVPSYTKAAAPWIKQYDFRFIEGEPNFAPGRDVPASTYSRLWIGDRVPRQIDMLSLVSISDAFFARIFHARREMVPFGTVTLTTYFHLGISDLASENISHVLVCADAKIFNRSYHDQSGELWSPSGKLIATTTQMGYFKA